MLYLIKENNISNGSNIYVDNRSISKRLCFDNFQIQNRSNLSSNLIKYGINVFIIVLGDNFLADSSIVIWVFLHSKKMLEKKQFSDRHSETVYRINLKKKLIILILSWSILNFIPIQTVLKNAYLKKNPTEWETKRFHT